MDPFGNLVVVNTLLGDQNPPKRRAIIGRESVIATVILLLAAVVGSRVLSVLGLEGPALSISGGVILFLVAMGMLFPSRRVIDDEDVEDPFIVPIAMPLIAGPSAISMVILLAEKHPHGTVLSAVALASLLSALILLASPTIFNFLGRRGSVALERLMGLLLIMIAVQMILNGLEIYMNSNGVT